MIVLTYEQVIDPGTPQWLMQIDDIAHQYVVLYLDDERVKMWAPDAIFNMLIWKIYTRFNIRIETRHIIPRISLNSRNLTDILTDIHTEIAFKYPEQKYERKLAVFTIINELYNFIVDELNAYVSSISLVDLCEIINDEKIDKIRKDMNLSFDQGTDVVEKKIAVASKQMFDAFGTPGALKNQSLLYYQQTGMLNKFQIPQMFLAYGPRTDVDDTIILRPVIDCTIEGIKDILSFAIESLSAKKSAFYQRVAVTEAQYMGRIQHIVCSTIMHIYSGDCGTDLTIKFLVTDYNYKNLLGKYIVEDGNTFPFKKESEIVPYIGKYVNLRSPTVCKHRDGYCSICGGLITRNINEKINVGILSSTAVIEPTTQKILSAKHLVKTVSQTYKIPADIKDYLILVGADKIHWNPKIYADLPYLEMGVSIKDLTSGALSDITRLSAEKEINESKFTKLTSVLIKDTRTDKIVTLSLISGEHYPFFSKNMLLYIRDNYDKVHIEGSIVWIPLESTDKFSIMKAVVINDNMMVFVHAVKAFLSSRINTYNSIPEALRDFSDIIYSKVEKANIMHIEVLLKAYMVTSGLDYRIPEVTDPYNVKFQTYNNILSNRSIGQQLAYQCLHAYLSSPQTYLIPKGGSSFDPFLGIL